MKNIQNLVEDILKNAKEIDRSFKAQVGWQLEMMRYVAGFHLHYDGNDDIGTGG